MKPYELICALVVKRKISKRVGLGAYPLAVAMGKPGMQPTLQKFMRGQVANPDRTTAEPIAAFFGIPVDALYSEKLATELAATLLADDTVEQDRSVSQQGATIVPKPMKWRGLSMDELKSPEIWVELEDDAMAPEFPAGAVIRFDTTIVDQVQFGNRVMIRARDGTLHFREYAQASSGWQAIPSPDRQRAFLTFKPDDGAKVVAIKTGHFVQGR